MSLQHAVMVAVNGLALSQATGLIFVMLIQPCRRPLHGWLMLVLAVLVVWAYGAIARIAPGVSPLSETYNVYLLFSGLALISLAFYLFVAALCELRDWVAVGLIAWTGIAALITLTLIWSDNAITYTETGGDKFTLEWQTGGYLVLAHAIAYGVIGVFFLHINPQAQVFRVPASLLLAGIALDLIGPLRALPVGTGLATIATGMIGTALLRREWTAPVNEVRAQLDDTNADLRAAVNDLSVERERAERLDDDLREANRYKTEFLTSMGHKLRTPLNSIVGYSELLLNLIYGDLTDRQIDRIEKIHRNGLDLLDLINDILDLNKIEGGRLELHLSTVRLTTLAEALMGTVKDLVGDKNLELHTEVEAPLRLIRADEVRIRQVLLNLLDNAVKFTPEGHVLLRAKNAVVQDGRSEQFPLPVIGWLADRAWVILGVEDTGIGIAPEHQAVIFEEFHHADDTIAQQYGGAGLGLTIAQKLAEIHTGRIWVRSQPGQGSTFFLALPALDEFDESTVETERSVRLEDVVASVLIIESHDDTANRLTQMLTGENYLPVRANDGPTGLARALEARPAAIVVDVLMPGFAGWDAIRRLKQDPNTVEIPLVIAAVPDGQPTGFPLGASAYLYTPIQRDELLTALARVQRTELENPVLVVDKDPADCATLNDFLTGENIPVTILNTGQAALDWLQQPDHMPGLVLIDLNMPEVSGFEVLYYLRSEPRLAGVPVVLTCAPELGEAEQAALRDHAARVIKESKPAPDSLIKALKTALGRIGFGETPAARP